VKRNFYQVPAHVAAAEAAALYEFMATGEPEKTQFLDEKNQILFDSLENLMAQAGRVGTEQLCQYLIEMNLLDSVGDLAYVKKVFACLEPAEVYA